MSTEEYHETLPLASLEIEGGSRAPTISKHETVSLRRAYTESFNRPCIPNTGTTADRVFKVFEHPHSSTASFLFSLLIMILIVVSSVVFVIQTEPKLRYPIYSDDPNGTPALFTVIESCSMYIFGLEYLGRIVCAPFVSWELLDVDPKIWQQESSLSPQTRKLWSWFKKPMNLVDLFAVAPFFVTLCLREEGSGLGFLRILRLSRVFRVFKMGKYTESVSLYAEMMKGSVSALILLSFFSLLNAVVFGSLIYFVESGDWDEDLEAFVVTDCWGNKTVSKWFTSIFQSFYWVFVTTTTVGYGDMYPVTVWGKVCAVVVMHLGVLAIAMPVTIIGGNFQTMMEEKEKQQNNRICGEEESQDPFIFHVNKIRKLTIQLQRFQTELDSISQSLLEARAASGRSRKISSVIRCERKRSPSSSSSSSVQNDTGPYRSVNIWPTTVL